MRAYMHVTTCIGIVLWDEGRQSWPSATAAETGHPLVETKYPRQGSGRDTWMVRPASNYRRLKQP
jgi:hypothetical protein